VISIHEDIYLATFVIFSAYREHLCTTPEISSAIRALSLSDGEIFLTVAAIFSACRVIHSNTGENNGTARDHFLNAADILFNARALNRNGRAFCLGHQAQSLFNGDFNLQAGAESANAAS